MSILLVKYLKLIFYSQKCQENEEADAGVGSVEDEAESGGEEEESVGSVAEGGELAVVVGCLAVEGVSGVSAEGFTGERGDLERDIE